MRGRAGKRRRRLPVARDPEEVVRALREGRLNEARQLGQLALSLGRVDGGPGRGDYTLNDVVRIVFDQDYRTEGDAAGPGREP